MGKPTICISEDKDADQLCGKAVTAFVFATRIVQFLFYLNPKFQASGSFLCLYRLLCVGPVRKPHCWFSHEAAPMYLFTKSEVLRPISMVCFSICAKAYMLKEHICFSVYTVC